MIYQLIAPTSLTATSPQFSGNNKNNIALCCNTLQGTETITLQIYDNANNLWSNALNNGDLYQINATNNFMSFSLDTQIYRIVKTATAAVVGLDMYTDSVIPNLIAK